MTRWNTEDLKDIIGKTCSQVTMDGANNQIHFHTTTDEHYVMQHTQDCCENVYIEDVAGDLNDLVGSPILMAEEQTYNDVDPPGVANPEEYHESFSWTFYKFATNKGYVTIRWYGSSNGYYGEEACFTKL